MPFACRHCLKSVGKGGKPLWVTAVAPHQGSVSGVFTNGSLAARPDRSGLNAEEVLSFNKSGAILPITGWLKQTPSCQDAAEMLHHCEGGVMTVWRGSRWRCDRQNIRTHSGQSKLWKEINLSILTNTSPVGWEEKAACWWLFDGWLIQFPSHLKMDHSRIQRDGDQRPPGEETCWCTLCIITSHFGAGGPVIIYFCSSQSQ